MLQSSRCKVTIVRSLRLLTTMQQQQQHSSMPVSMDEQSFPPAPAGYRVHVEGRAGILVPDGSSTSIPDKDKHQNVFVNPIQEFNRDVSIAAIRAWSEMVDAVKREQWEQKQAARKSRPDSEHASSKPSKKRRLEQDPSGSVSTAESASQVRLV